MAADFDKPESSDTKLNVLAYVRDMFASLGKLDGAGLNPPTGLFRIDATNGHQTWSGSAWADYVFAMLRAQNPTGTTDVMNYQTMRSRVLEDSVNGSVYSAGVSTLLKTLTTGIDPITHGVVIRGMFFGTAGRLFHFECTRRTSGIITLSATCTAGPDSTSYTTTAASATSAEIILRVSGAAVDERLLVEFSSSPRKIDITNYDTTPTTANREITATVHLFGPD